MVAAATLGHRDNLWSGHLDDPFPTQMMFFGVTTLASIAVLLNGLDIGLSQTLALPKVGVVWDWGGLGWGEVGVV